MFPPLDLATFDLRGGHYAIGMAIGQGSSRFELPAWWPEPPGADFTQGCARAIASIHPGLLDELYGHADAQAQPYDQLLRIICRERLGGRPVHVPEIGGCTSFAWRAPDGHIRVGRNYDFYPVQRVRQRIRLAPDGAQATIGMRGSVPCGRYDGVNEAGLFVSLHIVLAARSEHPQPGVPFHLIPRILLESCATVRQAIDLLVQIPHIHSFNYLLADPTEFVVVECHADRLRINWPSGDRLAVGNFYRHPDMRSLQRHEKQHLSRARVQFLESDAWAIEAPDPWTAVQRALTDHAIGVCGHSGGHTTLWSCIADLTERRIAYTIDAPCRGAHVDVQWPRSEPITI